MFMYYHMYAVQILYVCIISISMMAVLLRLFMANLGDSRDLNTIPYSWDSFEQKQADM